MPTSARVIPVPNCGAQTQASTMDPRPRAYHPAPMCSFRSFASAYPEVETGCALPFPSTDPILEADAGGPRTRPQRLAGARGGGPPGNGGNREKSGARGAQTRAAFCSRANPTLSVTKGAQPMGEPKRPGLQARDREGEPRMGEGM